MNSGGYLYSIWCIPNNWKDIKEKYGMCHIPHVTIETLLSETECRSKIHYYDKEYMIRFEDNIYDFNDITYKEGDNDLPAYGFYCELDSLCVSHRPHMTLLYSNLGSDMKIEKAPIHKIQGKVYMVNTVSSDPSKWKII
jgi:hypothetical protein